METEEKTAIETEAVGEGAGEASANDQHLGVGVLLDAGEGTLAALHRRFGPSTDGAPT